MSQKNAIDRDQQHADAINHEHEQAQACAQTAIEHAIRCGELLIAQKNRVKHGEFQDWVKAHCCFSHDTANVYMRATRKKTRGLVFSSLAALLAYEKSERRGQPEKFLHQELTTCDFGLPEGHDAAAWAYSQASMKLLRDILTHVRYLDPIRIGRGAVPGREFIAIKSLVHSMHVFTANLRNVLDQIEHRKPVVRVFAQMEWKEIGDVVNGVVVPDKELLQHAKALCNEQDAAVRRETATAA